MPDSLLNQRPTRAVRAGPSVEPTPPATRAATTRLRDPRLWAGVLLVAVSAAIGGRALATADDTTTVWSAVRDLPAGSVVTGADVAATTVHFADSSTGGAYVEDRNAVVGQRLAVALTAGELVAVSALTVHAPSEPQLPVGVAGADLPADLEAGDRVDLWAAPPAGERGRVLRVLDDIRVVAVDRPDIAGSGVDRQVLLALESPPDVSVALAGLTHGRPVLVRVDG